MSGAAVIRGAAAEGGVSFGREAWRQVWASWLARACLVVLGVFCLAALAGETAHAWYAWQDVTPPWQMQDLSARYLPPGAEHWLGTDGLGRDVFLRLVQGARIAFQVGVVSSLIAIPIGVLLGCLGGYFGGKVDDVVVWLSTTFASIPGLLFVLAIAMVVGKGLLGVFLAIGLTTWVGICRLIRAEVLQQKERGYVRAARALGFSHGRILFRHILPNVIHVALVSFTLRFPAAIGTEVFLSFLGIGAQGEPSWGVMISSARLRLWQGMWWELAAVTAAIFAVVLAFNLLGDALRDALDPRLRTVQD
ncbi:MAG: ABC transporter permease [Kiritimatiellae bacterium]|jgi:peptide/nickel transport system permease protein|nr:ABC transporter permease [Kiritimatiellia bacterium]NLD88850.1 ABC transporter permease [Lentisphaerota bacterium]HOU20759.1 ABC transporter permease [Kiritimatiellia bacterium]HPC20203.1 ABC transporter permease [Kiritimatiellia bacterium]